MKYKQMLQEIDDLVETDFCCDVTSKPCQIPLVPFTQEEAVEMAEIIGRVYLIAHAISCKACGSKYK